MSTLVAAKPSVLVVEDDPAVAASLSRGLRAAGFEVELATDGELAMEKVQTQRFDGVVLDLGLPRRSGRDILPLCAARDLIVVVLTADAELPTRLEAFAGGAADFVAKPFFLEELVARLRARIGAAVQEETLAWRGVEVSVGARTAYRDGAPIALTRAELDILVYLARREGRPITRSALSDHALAPDEIRTERTIDSHVAHLRRKLGRAGEAIETVWGIGYRFVRPPESGA